ncbi:MAG TPA: NADH-quinone oxidoreductase subunit J, partial [Thermodesulfobacteriota bacterium]|nr:NADH-quinone oxidoreductase subunit J [Thermodesulfobacteriota bacterium]
RHRLQKTIGVLLAGVLFFQIGVVFKSAFVEGIKANLPSGQAVQAGNTETVARLLFTEYLLPFEITSVLLLVAIVGAIVLAKRDLN